MPEGNRSPRTRRSYAGVLTVVLLIQTAVYLWASRSERVPMERPLDDFPASIGSWRLERDFPVEQEVRDQLKADDIMNRLYISPESHEGINVFVAYFRTQRTGQSPHSPKNCLPGAGWEPEVTGFLSVPVEDWPEPIRINRFVVRHGDERSVVMYWYQSQRRVIATEFSAKLWLVLDSIRYHRSDTALVRVSIPVVGNDDDGATKQGVAFVQGLFPMLKSYLPK